MPGECRGGGGAGGGRARKGGAKEGGGPVGARTNPDGRRGGSAERRAGSTRWPDRLRTSLINPPNRERECGPERGAFPRP